MPVCTDTGTGIQEDEQPFGTESYPRRSRLVHFTSELFIALAYQTICTFWYWFSALPKQASFGYGCTDDVNWYRRPRTTQTGIRQVQARAFNKYRHRRSTGTGVPYEQQQAFSRNFTMTRTVAGWNLRLLINVHKKDIFKTTTTLYCGSLLHAWL